jgi:hypothetical protein
MKKILLYLLILATNISNAQIIKGSITDSLTKEPVPYANIVLINGKGIYSDEKGQFELDIKNNVYDTLKISSLGYKARFFPLTTYKNHNIVNLKVSLSTKVANIEEVVISQKKVNYNQKSVFGESKEGNIGMTSLIGYETCLYIENPTQTIGRVKRAYIDLKRRDNADYIALFNIKFYEYDEKNNTPGKELYSKNIFINPKNHKYRLWIDVERYNIKFPKNGICVGVELINTAGTVEKYAKFGPMFRYTISKKNRSITWSNYHDTGWRNGSTGGKTGFVNPMIGVEVLLPSKE